jgi:hypothetical protein
VERWPSAYDPLTKHVCLLSPAQKLPTLVPTPKALTTQPPPAQLESAIAAVGGSDTAANALQGTPVLVLLPAASANLTAAALLGEPPANQTVFAVYGTPAPVSLLPCTSVGAAGTCAAAAVQLSANGSILDLSPSVAVTDVTPVDDGTNGVCVCVRVFVCLCEGGTP